MTTVDVDQGQRTAAFVERMFGSLVGSLDLYLIDLGRRLGLYEALDEAPATSRQLAERAGCAERYVREWLEQQATNGILDIDGEEAGDRIYRVPLAHREALLDPDSPAFVGALAACAAVLARPLPWLADAFRTGAGIPFERYGEEFVRVQDGMTRPLYANALTGWLAALPAVDERLRGDPPARVVDLCCGAGRAAIAIARAYPAVTVHGLDADSTSVAHARRNAAEAGVADRVKFDVRDVADPSLQGSYDLVTVFESLHDLPRPVDALVSARRLLAQGGRLVLADERTGDSFADPGPLDGFLYSVSVLACLPQSLAQRPSAGIGTVIRTATVEALAEEAGFSSTTVLPVEDDSWRFYELTP